MQYSLPHCDRVAFKYRRRAFVCIGTELRAAHTHRFLFQFTVAFQRSPEMGFDVDVFIYHFASFRVRSTHSRLHSRTHCVWCARARSPLLRLIHPTDPRALFRSPFCCLSSALSPPRPPRRSVSGCNDAKTECHACAFSRMYALRKLKT